MALAAVLAPIGLVSAMMLGPAFYAISNGSAPERSEGIVMVLVGAPLALVCFLGVRWIQQQTERLKLGP